MRAEKRRAGRAIRKERRMVAWFARVLGVELQPWQARVMLAANPRIGGRRG